MRLGYAIFAFVAACGFPRPQDVVDDAMADAADPGSCFGSYLHVCFDFSSDVPTGPQTWADAVVVDIDTDTSALCNQHNDQKLRASSTSAAIVLVFRSAAPVQIHRAGAHSPRLPLALRSEVAAADTAVALEPGWRRQ